MIDIIIGYISASIRMMTPIGLAATGELLVERSGVLNLSLEGTMLMGAFVAFVTTYYTGNPYLGIGTAIIVGILVTLLFGVLTQTFAIDQVLVGVALNLFALGATFFLYRAIFGWYVSPVPPKVETVITELPIPLLSEIPIIGPILFNQTVFTYILFLLVPITIYFLKNTTLGLHLKACGENPEVADYLGINVFKYRYSMLIIEGILGGIAGALYTISYGTMFLDNITGGRGFVAIAMVILGQWLPLKTFAATFLYAMVEAFQLRVQAFGLVSEWFPYQFALMLPYLVTLIALALFGRKVKGPAWLGKTYKRVK
ncbi:MAG: ABC transporter permease [Thermoprotei archaeon]|nr:MAG: ABC transporter permease [Thermoprotei archaeon]